jgi:hypothetical protein
VEDSFLKFIVHELNSGMVKSEMVVPEKRKLMLMSYSLKVTACC